MGLNQPKKGANRHFEPPNGAKTVKSPRENVSGNAQSILTLSVRLREFMKRYDLTRDEMAAVIRKPRGTFDHWLDNDVNPPARLLALMDLLEEESRARTRLGVHGAKQAFVAPPTNGGHPTALRGVPFICSGSERSCRFSRDPMRAEAASGS